MVQSERGAAGPATPDESLTRAALQRRFRADQTPRPAIYWCDLLASAGIGWAAFALAGLAAPGSWTMLIAAGIATLALYRSVLFIHELTHVARGAVPGFDLGWHLVAGLPLMVPSLMYVGAHGDHHRTAVYGTPGDPEYVPLARWSPLRIVGSSLLLVFVPPLLILRWGLLGPLSYAIPPLRRIIVGYASTLVMNASYRRTAPRGEEALRWAVQEGAAALVVWLGAAGVVSGAIAPHWLALWLGVTAAILILNQLRTLTAHRFDHAGESLDRMGQLADSINLDGSALHGLLAPVGLRYHALHHLLPSLPYHALGAVHRRLLAELPADSPYRGAGSPGIGVAMADLFRRAAHRAERSDASATWTAGLSAGRAGEAAGTGRAIHTAADAAAGPR
jgi:fatty acid desaturase